MSISDYYLLVFFANFWFDTLDNTTLEDPHIGHFLNVVFTNLSDEVSSNEYLHFLHMYSFIISTSL